MPKINPQTFDEIIARLTDAVPNTLRTVKADLEMNFRSILQAMFSKLDLVTREEFDTQTQVLLRTREKVEQLEQKIKQLEQQLQ